MPDVCGPAGVWKAAGQVLPGEAPGLLFSLREEPFLTVTSAYLGPHEVLVGVWMNDTWQSSSTEAWQLGWLSFVKEGLCRSKS